MVPIMYVRWLGQPDMSYSFFTNLPSSTNVTKFPALSHYVGGAASASVARDRLAVLLIMAAATKFLFAAVAAYLAVLLYHRLLRPSVEQKRLVGVLIGCVSFLESESRGPC
jgi:hypothetical protein